MRLRYHRLRRGLTQAQLAEKVNKTQAYISSLESGSRSQPSIGLLNALADALELSEAERAEFILSFALRPVGGGGAGEPTAVAEGLLRESA